MAWPPIPTPYCPPIPWSFSPPALSIICFQRRCSVQCSHELVHTHKASREKNHHMTLSCPGRIWKVRICTTLLPVRHPAGRSSNQSAFLISSLSAAPFFCGFIELVSRYKSRWDNVKSPILWFGRMTQIGMGWPLCLFDSSYESRECVVQIIHFFLCIRKLWWYRARDSVLLTDTNQRIRYSCLELWFGLHIDTNYCEHETFITYIIFQSVISLAFSVCMPKFQWYHACDWSSGRIQINVQETIVSKSWLGPHVDTNYCEHKRIDYVFKYTLILLLYLSYIHIQIRWCHTRDVVLLVDTN
jgi:hypothetical protein